MYRFSVTYYLAAVAEDHVDFTTYQLRQRVARPRCGELVWERGLPTRSAVRAVVEGETWFTARRNMQLMGLLPEYPKEKGVGVSYGPELVQYKGPTDKNVVVLDVSAAALRKHLAKC